MRLRTVALAGFALFLLRSPAKADVVVFTPASPAVDFAVNDGGFFVSGSPITMTHASSAISGQNFLLTATGTGYSDAGIVLYFNGGLELGQLQSVTVATDNPGAIAVNLWLDSGGDGQFFAFSGGVYQGSNGDSYGSFGNTTSVSGTSAFQPFAGPDTGATLAELQAKYPTTAAALWIGITNVNTADISSITVDALPEPASLPLAGAALLVLAAAFARRSNLSRHPAQPVH
jgi:hypothetical protein